MSAADQSQTVARTRLLQPAAAGRVEVDEFLLVCAFRYTLGRATYAVSIVAEDLIRLAPAMRRQDRELIIREIDEARASAWPSPVGMLIDHEQWMRVSAAMEAVS